MQPTTIEKQAYREKNAADNFYHFIKMQPGVKHVVRYTTHFSETVRRMFDEAVWNPEKKEIEVKKVEKDVVVYDPTIMYVVAWQEPVATQPLTNESESSTVESGGPSNESGPSGS